MSQQTARARVGVRIIAVGSLAVGVLALLWVATRPDAPPAAVEAPEVVASVPTPAAPRVMLGSTGEEPHPEVDLVEQARTLRAYVDGPGPVGQVHRDVSARIDAAGLDVTQRAWVHAKVQAFLDARASREAQVGQGAMSAADAAMNDDEAREALQDSLQRRTPGIASEVAALLGEPS